MIRKILLATVIFACLTAACTSLKSQEDRHVLRVLAYNIHHGEGMDGQLDLRRIADVIASVNPDLVALQEVDKNCKRTGNRDLAAELGKMLEMEHRFGKAMDFQGGEYGLAVLSKIPILETVCYPLPAGDEPRCALEVLVRFDGCRQPISFFSIHNDWKSEAVRVKEVKTLLNILSEKKNPIILAGDFNSTRTSPSMKLLEESQWNILTDKNGKPNDSEEPDRIIDFIVIKNFPEISVENGVIDERIASDHKPIFAIITFKH